jgi:hypothetical protein
MGLTPKHQFHLHASTDGGAEHDEMSEISRSGHVAVLVEIDAKMLLLRTIVAASCRVRIGGAVDLKFSPQAILRGACPSG